VLQYAQTIIAQQRLGRPLLGRAHFGSYLPDWHPWEDYRKGYAARRDLGGGAALTHIHEVDYMLWLLGAADDARGLASARSPLGTEVDEACGLVVRHASGAVSTITLSLAQKPASRRVEIHCDRGCLSLDLLGNSWSLQPTDGDVESGSADRDFQIDETYRAQAETFLGMVRTGADYGVMPGIPEGCAALRVSLSAMNQDRIA
jgi:predicted dehydrogenase